MKRILIVTDIQNDFCPGGALATELGDQIIPNVNLMLHSGTFERAIATQDWHPANHISFASRHNKKPYETIHLPYGEQVLWPDHCVQKTWGAEFRPSLDDHNIHFIVRKGYHEYINGYSGFFENDRKTATGMHAIVNHITGGEDFLLVICGIATDYCVFYSALDARRKLGYKNVVVVTDACSGVSSSQSAKALAIMAEAGVKLQKTEELL